MQRIVTSKTCLTCSDYIKPNEEHPKGNCKIAIQKDICWVCSHPNPSSDCVIERMEAYANSPEWKAEVEKRNALIAKAEAKEKALDALPKVKLKCVECGTITELRQDEYTDKRKSRTHRSQQCSKCQWITEHTWEVS